MPAGTVTGFLVSSPGRTSQVYKSTTTPANPTIGSCAGLEHTARAATERLAR